MQRLFQLILVQGDDAESFLQGHLTQDVTGLAAAGSLLTAWCNPKGRVIFVARMLHLESGIGLVLPGELAEAVVRRLSIYRLRAKVAFEIAGATWKCLAVSGDDDFGTLDALGLLPDRERHATRCAQGIIAVDSGAPRRVVELYGAAVAFGRIGAGFGQQLADSEWHKALIEAGYPTIVTATSERYTPHMLNLDRLGAVSFDKGCYTGQEIVARTEHLGSNRRRLMHYRLASGHASIGDKVTFDAGEIGEVLSIVDRDLLAVVPVELHGRTVAINGHPAAAVALPYSLPARGRGELR